MVREAIYEELTSVQEQSIVDCRNLLFPIHCLRLHHAMRSGMIAHANQTSATHGGVSTFVQDQVEILTRLHKRANKCSKGQSIRPGCPNQDGTAERYHRYMASRHTVPYLRVL